jgi:hypothetical protein
VFGVVVLGLGVLGLGVLGLGVLGLGVLGLGVFGAVVLGAGTDFGVDTVRLQPSNRSSKINIKFRDMAKLYRNAPENALSIGSQAVLARVCHCRTLTNKDL